VKEVGLAVLTADEEILCAKRAQGQGARLAMELAKTSLCEADGQKLSSGDGSSDIFWKDCNPKLRQLVMTAYAKIHAAEDDDVEGFLASQQARVG
jgi:hypothetical protein